MQQETIEFNLNGKLTMVLAKSSETLADLLREKLSLVGTKIACDEGTCGSCTVLIDGEAVYSCMILAMDCAGKMVETLEGLSDDPKHLHPLQRAFVTTNASQCGFCTPGMIMSVKSLLDKKPDPSKEEVMVALSGNVCRCTDYSRYIESALLAAKQMRTENLEESRNSVKKQKHERQ